MCWSKYCSPLKAFLCFHFCDNFLGILSQLWEYKDCTSYQILNLFMLWIVNSHLSKNCIEKFWIKATFFSCYSPLCCSWAVYITHVINQCTWLYFGCEIVFQFYFFIHFLCAGSKTTWLLHVIPKWTRKEDVRKHLIVSC